MTIKRASLTFLILYMMQSVLCMEHHDWEDNHVLQINREPARAYFIPYAEHKGENRHVPTSFPMPSTRATAW